MEWWVACIIILGGLLAIMASGLPVAFGFLLINMIGAFLFWGGLPGVHMLVISSATSVSRFSWLPLPLFVLMGQLMFRSGMAVRWLDVVDKWMGRLPGRLGLVAVAAGTLFASLTGSSVASAAVLTSTLTPEMEKRGYKKSMSLGPILGSSGLAMMIPPSGMAIILGSLADISIGKLLIAGIIPGLIMATLYAGYIIIRCWLQPSVAPAYEVIPTPLSEKIVLTAKYVLPLGFIIFMVTGVIFLGIATPTEAAALGVLGSVIVALFYGGLSWEIMKKSITETLQITVMILMIVSGSVAFSKILAFSGGSQGLIALATGLPVAPIVIIIAMMVLLIILGGPMSATPLLMISMPIYMPVVHALGFNPVWFGALTLLNMEMSATSPPFGLTLFVAKAAAPPGTTMRDVFLATLPFLGCDAIAMALMIAFPLITLWLPGLMY